MMTAHYRWIEKGDICDTVAAGIVGYLYSEEGQALFNLDGPEHIMQDMQFPCPEHETPQTYAVSITHLADERIQIEINHEGGRSRIGTEIDYEISLDDIAGAT